MDAMTDTPLARMARTTPTEYWNDSCSVAELEYAIANGAVGATSNPTIVGEVLKKELDAWRPRIRAIRAERPTLTDVEIAWEIVEEMSVRGAAVLMPVWQAIEEATFHGISINATVSFTVPQALAVGQAVERGLARREATGLDTTSMGSVCTLMIGRLDDWMKTICERDDIVLDPAAPNWAGLAVFKRAAAIYRERGYRTRLLAAAYRHHLHWSELIGGDVSMTIPYAWQRRFNASAIELRPRFDDPVPAAYVDELLARIPDFGRAYEPDGLTAEEFDTYGATVRTLRGFISSYWDLVRTIDDILLPSPDVRG